MMNLVVNSNFVGPTDVPGVKASDLILGSPKTSEAVDISITMIDRGGRDSTTNSSSLSSIMSLAMMSISSFEDNNKNDVEEESDPSINYRRRYHYTKNDPLGIGGFGIVYRGIRVGDGVPVAVKYILKERVTNWKELNGTRIPMEIAVLKKLSHVSGVVKLLDFLEQPENFVIIMERPEPAKDLFDYITAKGVLSEKEAKDFLRQLIHIIIQCHKAGVVHRDIKDENILIDFNTMTLKLIDFGAAAEFSTNDDPNFQLDNYDGTRVYAPPEWIQDKIYNRVAATVWSLGILLFVMVCGEIPFEDDKTIIRGHLKFSSGVSQQCQELVKICLKKNAVDRPSYEEILAHPWLHSKSTLTKSPNFSPWNVTKNSCYIFHAGLDVSPKGDFEAFFLLPESSSNQNSTNRTSKKYKTD